MGLQYNSLGNTKTMKGLAFASVFNPGNSSLPVLELLLIFIQIRRIKTDLDLYSLFVVVVVPSGSFWFL